MCQNDKIKVSVVGAKGKMGSLVCQWVKSHNNLSLALQLDRDDDLTEINQTNTDVVVEFSVAKQSQKNVKILLQQNVNIVVGTSGWTNDDVDQLKSYHKSCNSHKTILIAPNFSASAILMQKFAQLAAPYFSSCEIIEYHHRQKIDKPSGTAIATKELIEDALNKSGKIYDTGVETHSVRMDGYNAHQDVLFGNDGEVLKISQNSFSRESFAKGVIEAIQYVNSQKVGIIDYGMDKVFKI